MNGFLTQYLFGSILQGIADLKAQNTQILAALNSLKGTEDTLMLNLTNLTAKVQAETTVDQSAITLLNGLSQQIKDLSAQVSNEPTVQGQLDSFAAQLDASATALAAAITANTPAAPAPAPPATPVSPAA